LHINKKIIKIKKKGKISLKRIWFFQLMNHTQSMMLKKHN
jgi:hypothetical protein